MTQRDREARLRDALRSERAPGEAEAEERAWRLIQAARRERRVEQIHRRSRGWRSPAVRIAVVLGLVAVLVSPAGAEVRYWVRDAVSPGRENASPALTALPAAGRLLVQSVDGPWIVQEDGSKRLLGDYSAASWSPRGLFVAASSAHQLVALESGGEVHWSLARSGPVTDPSWNTPDGFRIAYLNGEELRVVAGDGTGDRLVARRVARVTPTWLPGPRYVLAFAEPNGSVNAVVADSGRKVFSAPAGPAPIGLQWSGAGSLMVVRPSGVELLDRRGQMVWSEAAPRGTVMRAARLSPDGARVAAIVTTETRTPRSRLLLSGPGRHQRSLFSGPGRFQGLAWSPDGRWILLGWRSADQWLFLNPSRPDRIAAISNITAQFAPGQLPPSGGFPGIRGWCCSPSR